MLNCFNAIHNILYVVLCINCYHDRYTSYLESGSNFMLHIGQVNTHVTIYMYINYNYVDSFQHPSPIDTRMLA